MTLIKEKNSLYENLYITKNITKINISNTDFKYIAISFQNGTILKFFFENDGKLLAASSKIENALLNDENIVIDQDYLEATRTTCNM